MQRSEVFEKHDIAKVKLGDDALTVLRAISDKHQLSEVHLFRHEVRLNWRQKYADNQKALYLNSECFLHNDTPGVVLEELTLDNKALQSLETEQLQEKCEPEQVYSVLSAVKDAHGRRWHIPMMNFHPEHGGLAFVVDALHTLRQLRPDLISPGVVLSTGRYWHYYGFEPLREEELDQFLSYFLMPSILVSPRYIGHRLYDGQGSLRLTGGTTAKPTVPTVVAYLN